MGIFLLTLVTAQVLASSITSFVESLPQLIENLPGLLAPWQGFLDQFGLRIDLEATAQAILAAAGNLGGTHRPAADRHRPRQHRRASAT